MRLSTYPPFLWIPGLLVSLCFGRLTGLVMNVSDGVAIKCSLRSAPRHSSFKFGWQLFFEVFDERDIVYDVKKESWQHGFGL